MIRVDTEPRLVLTRPDAWPSEVRLVVHDPRPLPEDLHGWVATLGLAGATWGDTTTELGWPASWLEVQAGEELRLAMIYRFQAFTAAALVAGPVSEVRALAGAARAVLAAGRPVLRFAEPVALREVWDVSGADTVAPEVSPVV